MLLIDGKLQPAQTQITPSKEAERAKLQEQIEQWKRNGGKIQIIPRGVSGGRKDGGTPDAKLSPRLAKKRRINEQRNLMTQMFN